MTTKKRKINPKYGPLSVNGEEYTVRINPPVALYVELVSGDISRIVPALAAIVREHPLVGEDDQPLPVDQWPLEDVTAFATAFGALMNALPPG